MRTTTRYYAALHEAVTSGRVRDIAHSDGRLESYTYERGVWNGGEFSAGEGCALRTSVTHGTVASSAGIPYKTTREVSIVDAHGQAVRDESYIYDGIYTLVSWTDREFDAEGHLRLVTRSTGEQERKSGKHGDVARSRAGLTRVA